MDDPEKDALMMPYKVLKDSAGGYSLTFDDPARRRTP